MNEVWVMAEQYEGKLKEVSFELLAWGRTLADKLGVSLVSILIGDGVSPACLEKLIKKGADKVYTVQDVSLKYFICENYAKVLEKLIIEYKPAIILAAATSSGRTLMPYVAIKVHAGLTADCTELDIEEGTGNLLQTRPAIGGNIMATIKTPDNRPQIATVRPKSARSLAPDENRKVEIKNIYFNQVKVNPANEKGVEVLGYRKEESGFSLDEADIIIAGGRGLKKAENFTMITRLTKTIKGAVGASRDAVDRGWVSYPHQIVLSGKTVSPKVYIAAGISGAIQHLAGIKTSETIISINNDPEANLHKLADLAIVGDAFAILPEIQKKLGDKNAKI